MNYIFHEFYVEVQWLSENLAMYAKFHLIYYAKLTRKNK